MNTVTKINIFLASPGDVPREREQVEQVVSDLNVEYDQADIVLTLKRWETHVHPDAGRPQDVINKQIGPYDIFIGIMWRRFGTKDDKSDSGTKEEFDIAYERWQRGDTKHILFYFCESGPPPAKSEDVAQYMNVTLFREQLEKGKALIRKFDRNNNRFESDLRTHLAKIIQEVRDSLAASASQSAQSPALPTGRLRLSQSGFAVHLAEASDDIWCKFAVVEALESKRLAPLTRDELLARTPLQPTVSVHLLDPSAGASDLEQVELGLKHARWQILWIPKAWVLTESDQDPRIARLAELERSTSPDRTWEFIREAQSTAAESIVERISTLQQEWRMKNVRQVMLDGHERDLGQAAKDLFAFFDERGIRPMIRKYGSESGKPDNQSDERILRANTLVFVSGDNGRAHVQQRLQIAIAQLYQYAAYGPGSANKPTFRVYVTPPPKDAQRFEVFLDPGVKWLDKETLAQFD